MGSPTEVRTQAGSLFKTAVINGGTSVGSSGVNELATYTLPRGSLQTGSILRVTAWGRASVATGTITATYGVELGPTTTALGSRDDIFVSYAIDPDANNDVFYLQATAFLDSAGQFKGGGFIAAGEPQAPLTSDPDAASVYRATPFDYDPGVENTLAVIVTLSGATSNIIMDAAVIDITEAPTELF